MSLLVSESGLIPIKDIQAQEIATTEAVDDVMEEIFPGSVDFLTEDDVEVEEDNQNKKVTIVSDDVNVKSDVGNAWDGKSKKSVYKADDYLVTFELTSVWNGGFNANIKIENTGDSGIRNWYLRYNLKNDISDLWNAEISSREDDVYIIKNAEWNADIAVGESIEFGFCGKGNFVGFPNEYELLGENTEENKEDYTIEYNLTDDWGSGFTGTISITNNTDSTIEDWTLEFDFERKITNVWDAVIESNDEKHYVIKNYGYNRNIKAGDTVKFGFNGNKGNADIIPSNYNLYSYKANAGYKVKFDVGKGDVTNIPQTQTVKKGMCAEEPTEPSKEESLFLGWYSDKEFTKYFDFENTPIEKDIILYAEWFDFASEIDTDGDGLTDALEDLIGTDSNKEDTDGDGLSDYLEMEMLDTNPLLTDTDENGINDGDEDFDGDGLSNKEEVLYDTDLLVRDTDEDGLTDYEEVIDYHTDPLNVDTDQDGLRDNSEIRLDTDPNKADTDGNGVKDGNEYYEQEILKENYQAELLKDNVAVPSITIQAKGDVNSTVYVEEYTGHLRGEERVYVGKLLEVKNSGMKSGKISFSLGEEYKVKNYQYESFSTNGLVICYSDGEDTYPLEIEFDEENNTISSQMCGDGIYFVLNVVDWLDSFGLGLDDMLKNTETSYIEATKVKQSRVMAVSLSSTDKTDKDINIATVKVKGQADIVFVVDTTGSMSPYIRNVKNNIIAFVEELEAANIRSNFALVDYRDITCDGQNYTHTKENKDDNSNWFKTAEEFKQQIELLSVNGGGDAPETAIDALEMARQLDMRTSSQKFFVLVTDAGYKIDNNYGIKSMDEMIDLLVEDHINTSVVSNSGCMSQYIDLCEKTGGIYANVSGNFKDELLGIADNITKNTNDGCWIALNGTPIQIVKLLEKPSPTSVVDTDRDGLLDQNELISTTPIKRINIRDYILSLNAPYTIVEQYIDVYDYYSNPAVEDTDSDGLMDGRAIYVDGKKVAPRDQEPKVQNGLDGIWKEHVKQYMFGNVATEYSDDYGLEFPDLSEKIYAGLPNNQKIANAIVKGILKLRETANVNETEIRNITSLIKKYCHGEIATIAGAYVLNFVLDTQNMAYHSQPETWQKYFGYNDFYDEIFKIASNMNKGYVEFNLDSNKYRLWMWKGDYWNLYSGAEIGLYCANKKYSGTMQYDVVDFTAPMSLSLYNYYGSSNIENIFNWTPTEAQWWVTGFSGQNAKFMDPKPNKMVTIGKIDLSGHTEIYEAIKEGRIVAENLELIIDEDSPYIWVNWYEGVRKRK